MRPDSNHRDLVEAPDELRWDRAIEQQERVEELLAASSLAAAEGLQRWVIAELDAAVGPGHPDAAHARSTLALVLERGGALAAAAEQYDAALAVLERWADEDAAWPLLLSTLKSKAANACARADYTSGRTLLARAAELAGLRAGPNSVELALVANARGVLEKLAGRLEQAEAHYALSRAIFDGLAHPLPASLWHNLAGLACARADFSTATVYAERAIVERRLEDEGESLGLASDWAGLGDVHVGLGRLDEAVAAYREALEILARTGNAAHPEHAYVLHGLADAEAERGRVAEAEALYRRALDRKLELFGPAHHEVAASRNNLAALWAGLGRVTEARAESRRAVEAAAACPDDHPVRVGCEQLLATLERGP